MHEARAIAFAPATHPTWPVADVPHEDPQLRRDVGRLGLLFASLGSIIGAGWLFAALAAAQIAGPAAVLSWIIGGAAVTLLALLHAELGAAYPVAGGSARFPEYAFGRLVGFTSGWVAFLGAVTVAPLMVEAALLYASDYLPGLTRVSGGRPVLTAAGYAAAVTILLAACLVNVRGVRWLARVNTTLVWWKLVVPLVTVGALLSTSLHASNFTSGGGFMPAGWKGVLIATSAGGIVFACSGFEQAVQLGGESRDPRRAIPLAILGAMGLAVALYVLLQVAFIGALPASDLAGGWGAVTISHGSTPLGPFAGLATALGLGWLAVLLYTGAIVSPAGTGLLYTGGSARLAYALSRSGMLWPAFSRLTRRGTPGVALTFAFACGTLLLLPFPGWQQLVGFIAAAAVVAYGLVPVAFGALRRQDRDRERPFRLPLGSLLAPLAFVVASEMLLFTGWAVVWKLLVAIGLGLVAVAVRRPGVALDARSAAWLWPYLGGMGVVSYLSSFDTGTPSTIPLLGVRGPTGDLPFGWDVLVVAVLSLTVYAAATRLRLPDDRALARIGAGAPVPRTRRPG